MLLPLRDMAGRQTGEIEVSDAVFAAPINGDLMHQALLRQLANARLGTHKTKTRREVRGGGRKPWRQKGTGRARQGSTRSPQWIGGGVVFGPRPRKYTKAMPKKMRRAALRSALSVKAAAGQIAVVDGLLMDEPKTKAAVTMLEALELGGQRILLVLGSKNMPVERSFANLPNTKSVLSSYLSVRDLLGHDALLFTKESIELVEEWLGGAVTEASLMVTGGMEE